MTSEQESVYKEISQERDRQDRKWGPEQDHTAVEWMNILGEEFGEAAKEANKLYWDESKEKRKEHALRYREETIHVAAVAVAMVENLNRITKQPSSNEVNDGTAVYNKIVRDNMPSIIAANGNEAQFRTLSGDDLTVKLKEKIVEELDEYLADGSIEELADLIEVISALVKHLGVKPLVDIARVNKIKERGSFSKGLYMTTGKVLNPIT